MINKEHLTDGATLADITQIQISGEHVRERIENYIKAVKNPYCFRVKNTRVKVSFSKDRTAQTIENALVNIVNGSSG